MHIAIGQSALFSLLFGFSSFVCVLICPLKYTIYVYVVTRVSSNSRVLHLESMASEPSWSSRTSFPRNSTDNNISCNNPMQQQPQPPWHAQEDRAREGSRSVRRRSDDGYSPGSTAANWNMSVNNPTAAGNMSSGRSNSRYVSAANRFRRRETEFHIT